MDTDIIIALVGGLISMLLSSIIPCLLKENDKPFVKEVKQVYETNKQLILASSLIIVITIYLALKVSPSVMPIVNISDYVNTSYDSSTSMDSIRTPIIMGEDELPFQLRNLVRSLKR